MYKIIICIRIEDDKIFLPGSKIIKCAECGKDIALSKETSNRKDFNEYRCICIQCLPDGYHILAPPTNEEIKTAMKYLGKGDN